MGIKRCKPSRDQRMPGPVKRGLKLLLGGLDHTGADREAILAELHVLHGFVIIMKISDGGGKLGKARRWRAPV